MKVADERLPLASDALGFACQTYSWQMSLDRYRDHFDIVASEVAAAGFGAIETEVVMLGKFFDAGRLHELLDSLGLTLAALTLVAPWSSPVETPEERDLADRVIEVVRTFPGTKLNLCQEPVGRRDALRASQDACLSCIEAIAGRARRAGVPCTFHPNSPPASKFRTAEDYAYLLAHLPKGVGFTPDLGHIAKGGMDALQIVKAYRASIDHVHVKDMAADGTWVPTGEGVVPIKPVVEYLRATGFKGWVVMEDESASAEARPYEAALRNHRYVSEVLLAKGERVWK
jgi:inosose dehydratase